MISEIDIKDMKAQEPVKATNHVGYGVQYLHPTEGWQWCSVVFALKDMAIRACVNLEAFYVDSEFRVYEVVK
jgi:hypothetical protein